MEFRRRINMNISEKAKGIIDSCRFCWMCRHICPIGNATGLERNTARARALGASLVVRGATNLEEISKNVYECALCGASNRTYYRRYSAFKQHTRYAI